MTTSPLEVWAPRARRVAVQPEAGDPIEMHRVDGGWWRTDAPFSGAYRFAVDGDALPDPRSPWQPQGIHGPSHTVDHSAFAWSDQGWHGRPLPSSVLYELHVGTFTPEGTFDAAIERLPHLRDVGVTAIELMPVAEFPGRHGWGYDGVLLYAPHHAYGGPDGLKRLVDASHAMCIAVVLDVVYNHLGPSGNHLERFGPYFTDRHGTPWGRAVNLDDHGSDQVRRFFCDNALQWLRDYHIDGLRLDAVHAMYDLSAVHFLEQLATEVDRLSAALGRTCWLIAESDLNDPRLVRSRDAHGFGLDAAWSDDYHHALHAALTGERDGYYADFGDTQLVATALEHTYISAGGYSPFRDRHHGRAADVGPERFVCFAQNHDQVGNRAQGERLAALVPPDALRGAAALTLLGPNVPLLFQGEEWAASTPFLYFTDHDDPQLAQAVRDGRRAEFAAFSWEVEVPDPQDEATYLASKLDWSEVDDPAHDAMLDWYRRLLDLRARLLLDLVGADDVVTADAPAPGVVVMRRGTWTIAVNLGAEARTAQAHAGEPLLTHGDVRVDGDVLALGPYAVSVRAALSSRGAGPRA